MLVPNADGKIEKQEIPLRTAMNEVLRDEYTSDSQRGLDKWNKTIRQSGIDFELTLPSSRFHRNVGIFAGLHFDPDGNLLSEEEWNAKKGDWLPNEDDETFVKSLMNKPIYDPGQMANWIAAPSKGIKGKPVDFEYVRHDQA